MGTEKIGFIGLGNMGHPMSENLENAGFPLSVYNRSKNKTEGYLDKTLVCNSIAELINNSDIIFTMLSNNDAVKEVYATIVEEKISGKLFIDMSTISKDTSLQINDSLKAKGASLIDAPVAGSVQPAKEGTLVIMAGGEQTDIERALPYLNKIGKKVNHLGKNGSGLATKIAVNYYLSIVYQGLAEAVLFAEDSGINRENFLEIINESACGSGATKIKTPSLIENSYEPAFSLNNMLKDVLLAKDAGAAYPIGKVVAKSFQDAQENGMGEQDVIAIIDILKKNLQQGI